MNNLHDIQMQILRELLYKHESRFSELNISKINSDHFTYHIKVLLDQGLITKTENGYSLTAKGKEFSNTMDTETAKVEKQAKIGVLIIVEKVINGQTHLLIQKRLKQPYYGFYGFVTGKVRWGEKVLDTAHRELFEETGITTELEYRYMIHEHVYSKEGELLEDKFFNVLYGKNPIGELTNTKDGENEWVSVEDFFKTDEKFYDEEDLYNFVKDGNEKFIERVYFVGKF